MSNARRLRILRVLIDEEGPAGIRLFGSAAAEQDDQENGGGR